MGSLDIYFNQINSIPLLTAEDEKLLAAKARLGDKSAIETLVASNLKFVVKVAYEYKRLLKEDGLDLEDLVMEGNIALVTAAQKFDPSKNVRFCTYAVWWIKNAIYRALEKKMKCPLSWTAARLNVVCGSDENAEPRVNRIADKAYPNPGEEAAELCMEESLDAALKRLKPKEEKVLRLRYGFDSAECMTLEQIGKILGHTKEGIRQIEKSGLKKLREEFDLVA